LEDHKPGRRERVRASVEKKKKFLPPGEGGPAKTLDTKSERLSVAELLGLGLKGTVDK